MLFSILIANYNNGHFFNDCYHSIIKQTYLNWEVIIVDDGSTDHSVAVINDLIKDDNRFKLFHNDENKGCGYTKRRCAELATGELCGFLDPDDTLEADAISMMVNAHIESPDAAIITSKHYKIDLNLNKVGVGNQGSSLPKGFSYLNYGKGALTHFASFKRNKYRLTGGINATYKRAVDQDLYYKLEEVGGHKFLDACLYNYRINPNSISENNNQYKARYWHFCAIIDAYKRRKSKKLVAYNFSKYQIKKFSADYYWKRFLRIKNTNKNLVKLYFLCKATQAFPSYILKSKFKKGILFMLGEL
jgi:glycosyltransferase involved in cell wall biosynthesis